jgi:hypothetical protein
MRLTEHITLNSSNIKSMAAVFLDIAKAFDTTWHSGLLYKLSELEFSTSLTKLIASFLTDGKFKVLVEGVPQGSVLVPILYILHMNDFPAASGTQLALFADANSIYATEKYKCRVLYKQQRVLTAVNSWLSTGT